MITIWVNRKNLEFFVESLPKLHTYENIICDYKTHPPRKISNYIQMQITYDEFIQLEEKNVVV
jgi:hypothetical protein